MPARECPVTAPPPSRFSIAVVLVPAVMPGPAVALDLFARHQVSVEFATADGKPLADAEVRVFAPGSRTPRC